MTRIVNGINVDELEKIIGQIEGDPERAKFTIRTETEWKTGCLSKTFIKRSSKVENDGHPFVVESDEPPALLGSDLAPNAVEFVLHGLASCLAVGFSLRAAHSGMDIKRLKFFLAGDIDLNNFFGFSEEVRPGLQNVNVKCQIETNSSPEEVESLLMEVLKRSAVMDVVKNEVPISVELLKE